MQENYAFIDSQNLHLGIRYGGWKLDFAKFRKYLKDKYKVSNAFLFIGYVEGNEKLYANLQKWGYIVIFKPTLEHTEGEETVVKGNVDAELVLHAMIEWDNYDKAVIVSGDGDFHCLIQHLAENNKLLKILCPNTRYSSLLRKFAKYIININSFRNKVQMRTANKDKKPAEQPKKAKQTSSAKQSKSAK